MVLPNLIYAGADKAGSTWLAQLLGSHPDIWVHPAKDLYFFDRFHARGQSWYERQFADAGPERYRVELSHNYMYSDAAMQRMHSSVPGAKVLISIRPPFERMVSEHLHLVRKGFVSETDPLSASVREYRVAMVDRSLYAPHVRRAQELFGRDAVLVVDFRDISADPTSICTLLSTYLDVDEGSFTIPERANPARVPRRKGTATLVRSGSRALRAVRLERLLGRLKFNEQLSGVLFRHVTTAERPAVSEELHEELDGMFRSDQCELEALLTGWSGGDDWLGACP